jgi:hypothetical protein
MDRMTNFILMLILEIPAIVLSIVIFAHFALNRQARSKLKNHGWIVLLIVNFFQLTVDLPMPMSYFRLSTVWPPSNAYCVWWTWYEFSINTVGLFLMAWISLERHILIFRPHAMLEAPWKKWIFHIIPIILCLIWTPAFYFVIVVISPHCSNIWDFNTLLCDIPCYYSVTALAQFDFTLNLLFPIMMIMFANLTLVIRVIYQKISRKQVIHWQRHRKMVLQLWIVSSLYMGFWLPLTITEFIQFTAMPSFMIDQLEIMEFVVYFIPLFLPMICLSTLPELVKKIMDVIPTRQTNVIGVVILNRGARQTATVATGR